MAFLLDDFWRYLSERGQNILTLVFLCKQVFLSHLCHFFFKKKTEKPNRCRPRLVLEAR